MTELNTLGAVYVTCFCISLRLCVFFGRRCEAARDAAMQVREQRAAEVVAELDEAAAAAKYLRSADFLAWEQSLPGIARRQAA